MNYLVIASRFLQLSMKYLNESMTEYKQKIDDQGKKLEIVIAIQEKGEINYTELVKHLNDEFANIKREKSKLEERVNKLEKNSMITSYADVIKNSKSELKTLIKDTIVNSRDNNIVITCIPYRRNENLYDIFSKICSKIGIRYEPLVTMNRFKGKNDPFNVKFVNIDEKNEFFRHYKKIAKKLTIGSILNIKGNHTRIWIQHDMDTPTYIIYKKAIKLEQNKKIEEVYHNPGGIITIKLYDNDDLIIVESPEHLDDLIKKSSS